MYYYLIIATQTKLKLNLSIDALFINCNFTLIDDHHLKYEDKVIEFEYLIYSNKILVEYMKENLMLFENNIPITNFYYQTSLENIFFINETETENKILEIINND